MISDFWVIKNKFHYFETEFGMGIVEQRSDYSVHSISKIRIPNHKFKSSFQHKESKKEIFLGIFFTLESADENYDWTSTYEDINALRPIPELMFEPILGNLILERNFDFVECYPSWIWDYADE